MARNQRLRIALTNLSRSDRSSRTRDVQGAAKHQAVPALPDAIETDPAYAFTGSRIET
jgi:hypothetical protein